MQFTVYCRKYWDWEASCLVLGKEWEMGIPDPWREKQLSKSLNSGWI